MADHPDYPRRVACLRSCEDHNVRLCMTAPTLWNNRGLKLWWNKMSNERSGYARGHLVESSEATGGGGTLLPTR
jgi:hypothetical protein